MMNIKLIKIFLVGLLVITACGTKEAPLPDFSAGSQAWIDAPLPGSSLPLAAVEIVAHAANPASVASFEISLNGQPLAKTTPDQASIDQTLMYMRHSWRPAAPGTYLIEVKALDRNNKPGPPAQVMVVIGTKDTSTATVRAASIPTPTATGTLAQGVENTPTVTPTVLACDLATFVADVNVPDGTEFAPGKSFRKTWRVINAGSCDWSADYSIAFVSGDQLGAADSLKLGVAVKPGHSIDISVPMQAPDEAGNYAGHWKLRNAQGQLFSFSGGGSLSVEIQVVTPKRATATTAPHIGCVVRVPGDGTVCKYPCPKDAKPGTPCKVK